MFIQSIRLRRLNSYLLNNWPVLVLCSVAALVLLWGLGERCLVSDEARYARISKEMVQSGDWLTPHFGYEPSFDKPPLLMWLTAVFYRLFGVNEFWSRAASAFSGIGVIIFTYLVGKFVYNTRIGFIAALVLLTNYHFVWFARSGWTDIMLTLFILMTVYAYLRLEKDGQKWWYMIWISCALAFMVKSAGGLIAPAVIALMLLLDKRFIVTVRSRHFWQGLILAFVIVAPWHIIMYLRHGQVFIDEYIGYRIITRATRAIEGHIGSRFFYVDILRKNFSPWFYLVPFALILSIKENIRGESRSRILLFIILLVFGLYTVVRTKIHWYIIPLYPSLAILTASMVAEAFRSYKTVAFSGLAMATFVVALIAPVYITLIFGFVGLFVIFFSLATKRPAYQSIVMVACAFFIVVGLTKLFPLYSIEYRREVPVAMIARMAASTSPDDREPLIIFSGRSELTKITPPTPLFYSDRPIQEADNLEDLAGFTNDHQTKKILLAKENLELLSMAYEVHVLAEAKPFLYATIKLRNMQ